MSDNMSESDSASSTSDETSIRMWKLPFLPKDGDLTIVCGDTKWMHNEPNPGGAFNALKANKSDLAKCSPFFADMFALEQAGEKRADAPGTEEGEDGPRIKLEDRCHIVVYVLSAALQPTREWLATCKSWGDLNRALRLATKWNMAEARTGIFFAMQECLLTMNVLHRNKGNPKFQLVDCFVEGARQGNAALASVASVLRVKASAAQPQILDMEPLQFTEHHFIEIGADGCSRVAQALMQLIQEGKLRC